MKKILALTLALAFTTSAWAQVISSAGSGSGGFRVTVQDPFSSPSFSSGSASFSANTFGWPNSGSNTFNFYQMVQFDVTGFESDLNDSGNTITLNLNSITNLFGVSQAGIYFSTLSSIDAQGQGNGGANGLLASAALPSTGTAIDTNITTNGSFDYDVTSILQSLDYSTNKQVYFRLQVIAPTSSPGINQLGTVDLNASTLTIAPIPEPTSAALMLGAVSLLALRRRRSL